MTETNGTNDSGSKRRQGSRYDSFKIKATKMITSINAVELAIVLDLPLADIDNIEKANNPGLNLIQKLQDINIISESNIDELANAMEEINLEDAASKLREGHSKIHQRESERLYDELQETEGERQQLSKQLQAAEEKLKISETKMKIMEDEKQKGIHQLEKTKIILKNTKCKLEQSQLEYAAESMGMKEVLKRNIEAMNTKTIISSASVNEEEEVPDETETRDISHESALAADYGRLMVNVAEELTLDSTLRLATLFNLPPAETDMLRRISLVETSGIPLLNLMKTRNVINIYDVTNLQKGLMYIKLHKINTKLVIPYQQKVDPFLSEENSAPKLLGWPSVSDNKTQNLPSIESEKRNETGGSVITNDGMFTDGEAMSSHQRKHDERNLVDSSGRIWQPKDIQLLQIKPRFPYIEHSIKKEEGGTISVMGVHLTIPKDALTKDSVICVSVMYDPDVHLPGEDLRRRMTPLIKLEPNGLTFRKSVNLIIPHSAIIPEPQRHSTIVFSGRTKEDLQKGNDGEITWAEDKSIEGKLHEEKISLDIKILSWIYINLVSADKEQKHIFRIVPFIDGILDVKDDVLITVCFCKDSNEEYNLILENYKTKLSLGNFATFQISRKFEGSNGSIELKMSSQDESYYLNKEESLKCVDIDHLCAASRVFHQFRLKRKNNGDTEVIDVNLKVSQLNMEQTTLIFQAKVKNILLSLESKEILYKEVFKELALYEKLKGDVVKLLEEDHCEKLCVGFELMPAEIDQIKNHVNPGNMLWKILDERELIMPDKMIGLYKALKVIHLDKVARVVLEYMNISKTKYGKEPEEEQNGKKNIKKEEYVIPQVELTLTPNAKLLVEEGYERFDVQRLLKFSHEKLDLARRLLQLVKEEHGRLLLLSGSNFYKEQYFDQHGGELDIAGIHLIVPAGALQTGRIVSLMVSTDPGIKGPVSPSNLRLAPFFKFGPENLTLQKPVILIIPHCAFTSSTHAGLDVYSGQLQTDKTINWSLEKKQFSCIMKSLQFEVEAEKPCLIGLLVPHKPNMRKRVCVIPIIKGVSNVRGDLTIDLWFYNDNDLEHKSLINEEVYQQKCLQLHDPISIVLKSKSSYLRVSITSSTVRCSPSQNKVDVDMDILWLQNRHKVSFHLHNKGIKDTVNLDIESKYGVSRKILFQLHIQFKIESLLRIDQIISPFQNILPESIIRSFNQLKQKLSEHIDADQAFQLASIFQLSPDVITNIRNENTPGTFLLERLTKKSLISAANIAALENTLTEQGNEACATFVRDFRKSNQIVQAITYPKYTL